MHTIFLGWSAIHDLSLRGYEAVVTVAYTPYIPRSPESLADHYEHLLLEVDRLKNLGIRAVVALGIHPRCFRPEYTDKFLEVLKNYIRRANVIGEIGLETCSDEEIELLKYQLRLVAEYELPAIIHTPRNNKLRAVRKIVEIIKSEKVPEEKLVIDHIVASEDILEVLKSTSANIGVTVQQGKASIADVMYIIDKYPELVDRVLINSDAGRDPSDHLAVVKTYNQLCRLGYGSEAFKITSVNAKKLIKY